MAKGKKKGGYVSTATKQYVQKKIESNQETKFRSTYFTNQDIDVSTNPFTYTMTDLAGGTTPQTRIGNQINVTGYHFEGWFLPDDAPVGNPMAIIRYVVYINRADVDTDLSAVGVYHNIDKDKYTILHDQLYCVTAQKPAKIMIRKKFNFGVKKGISVQFDGALGTDLAKNAIKIYIVADNVLDLPTLTGHGKLYFKDS